MTSSPEYYRQKASETFDLARRVDGPDQKTYLLKVAERYEELAARADENVSGGQMSAFQAFLPLAS